MPIETEELNNLNKERKNLKKINKHLQSLALKYLKKDGFDAEDLKEYLPRTDKSKTAFLEVFDEYAKKEGELASLQLQSEREVHLLEQALNKVQIEGKEATQNLDHLWREIVTMETVNNAKCSNAPKDLFTSIRHLDTELKEQQVQNALLGFKLGQYPSIRNKHTVHVQQLKSSIETTIRRNNYLKQSTKTWSDKIDQCEREGRILTSEIQLLDLQLCADEELLQSLKAQFQMILKQRRKREREQSAAPIYTPTVLQDYNETKMCIERLRKRLECLQEKLSSAQ